MAKCMCFVLEPEYSYRSNVLLVTDQSARVSGRSRTKEVDQVD